MNELLPWLVGIFFPLLGAMFAYWKHVENRQDQNIDKFHRENTEAHKIINEKIDKNHETLTDRLMRIWQHLNEKE